MTNEQIRNTLQTKLDEAIAENQRLGKARLKATNDEKWRAYSDDIEWWYHEIGTIESIAEALGVKVEVGDSWIYTF